MKFKSIPIVILVIFTALCGSSYSYAISLDLESDMTTLRNGWDFTVNVVARDSAELSGALLSLTYPKNAVVLANPAVTTDFFDFSLPLDTTTGDASSIWTINTENNGIIYLSGLNRAGSAHDSKQSDENKLFSIHFKVKSRASAGSYLIRLTESSLCNGPAGWGIDQNNNGIFDSGDTSEKAPVLFSVGIDTMNGRQADSLEVQTSVLLETLDPAPGLAIKIIPSNGGTTVDQCPDDGNKTEPGDCGCGVPDTDSDNDGIPNCLDMLFGPLNGDTNVSLSPVFEISPYPDLENAGADAAIIWQISKNSSFTDIVFEMTGAPDQNQFRLPDFILEENTTYFWRILYSDGTHQAGVWDAVGRFTTGLDDMIDLDQNGIPDEQGVGAGENLIVQNHPNLDETNLMVVKAGDDGFQYGLMPGNNVKSIDRLKWIGMDEIAGSDQWPVNMPFGLLSYRLYTTTPGATVSLPVYFSEPLPPWFEWWKYDPEIGLYDFSQYVTFADDMMSAVLTLTDGGAGDGDHVANGIIVDPGGPAGELDQDGDGVDDSLDGCPNDPDKTEAGACGCGNPEADTDNDGTPDCIDECPNDFEKVIPGDCGCGVSDKDTDNDGIMDCNDGCPEDPYKMVAGACGCGVEDTDTDNDGAADCNDNCPSDVDKTVSGDCGCGIPEIDSDNNGIADCIEVLRNPANGQTNVSLTPQLEVVPVSGNIFDGIIWQISRDTAFSDLVFEYSGTPEATVIQVPDFVLDEYTTYFWRILYKNNTGPHVEGGMAKFTTGADDLIDLNSNGIPDDQEVAGDEILIAAGVGDENENTGKILKSKDNKVQYKIVAELGVSGIDRFMWMDMSEITGSEDWTVKFPYGLLTFRLYTDVVGDTVSVIIHFSKEMAAKATWWKYDLENGVYDYSQFISFADDMKSVTLTLTDGGSGDADGVVNGVIVDPGGIVKPSSGSDSSGCFVDTVCIPEKGDNAR